MAWHLLAYFWRLAISLHGAYFCSRHCGQVPAHLWSVVTCRVSMCAPLHVLAVLLSFVASLSLVLEAFWLASNIFFPTEFLIQCDRCLGWSWVWRAGLVAGLWLGQAFGVFLVPGFGVGSSSPKVPRDPTSMCDVGIKWGFSSTEFHGIPLNLKSYLWAGSTRKWICCKSNWFSTYRLNLSRLICFKLKINSQNNINYFK